LPEDKISVGVKITGGLGDYVILSRVIRDLEEHSGKMVEFYIFCSAPGTGSWVWKNIPYVKRVFDEIFFDHYKSSFDCVIYLNQFIFYDEENINIDKIMNLSPAFGKVLASCRRNRRDWNFYIDNHPVLDGAFAHTAVARGFNRYNFIYHLLGIEPGEISRDFFTENDIADELTEKYGSWITINTGFDANFVISQRVATKCYPADAWNEVVKLLKTNLPETKIVQIGGVNSIPVKGVDENLSGKIPLPQSVGVLKKSSLHIDIEGGLVHVARSLGIKSVVIFGPTSMDYFGYPNNVNLKSEYCGNCWWTTERWMEICPRKHDTPRCLELLSPEKVADTVIKCLQETTDK
jgi:hypothetical protein